MSEKKFTHNNDENKIPKIIHYCWFGGNPIPEGLQECMNSWKKLHGYQIMRWDESNCFFDENEFIKCAQRDRQLCFISDYYRLRALYEYGGIYLDTDVIVYRDFDELLKHDAFLNFVYDCSVGTAVIGSRKKNPLIKNLLDMYDRTIVEERRENSGKSAFRFSDGKLYTNGYMTNNYYFTYYILKHYPDFKLNNSFQVFDNFVIYPKELFEIGTLTGKHFTVHLNDGAWRTNKKADSGIKGFVKRTLSKNKKVYDLLRVVVRKNRYRRKNKDIPFYKYSVAQKKNEELPLL